MIVARFKELIKHQTKLRKKLMGYFLIIALMMGISSFYAYYNTRLLTQKMSTLFLGTIRFSELNNSIKLSQKYLDGYLSAKDSDSLTEYYRQCENLKANMRDLETNRIVYGKNILLIQNLSNMCASFLEETDAAINAKRGRNVDNYADHYQEASNISNNINFLISQNITEEVQQNTNRYFSVSNGLSTVQMINFIVITGTLLVSLILISWFTITITNPILKLSRAADEISRGNYEVEKVRVTSDDEMKIMADAFNQMTSNIKEHIDDMKTKAELENQIKAQEMQVLLMKNLLKDAQLMALQAQINPHFLFNTLNAGVQIAMMEGADKTSSFIENVAELFRYNMKKIDGAVTLEDEINNIRSYLYILKSRFGDRVDFIENIDPRVIDLKMPCLILQPIVENAYIHGIREMDQGGKISLTVTSEEDNIVTIAIHDNGKGMSEDELSRLINKLQDHNMADETQTGVKTHSTGIGLDNIINRLKLYFNSEDVFSIRSSPGMGTTVTLHIKPIQNE